ncbi:MAG: PAS domain-containing protein [Alphaproteobacteria bacterium]|nr:PAS domain-containing protein [Alphaproteobacteria bacterium]
MLSINSAAIALAIYIGGLFLLAAWGDRRATRFDQRPALRAVLLSLSLAVYCTSWTFYGAVGEASRKGWDYLPIYLGPALLFLIGFPLIRRLVTLGRKHATGSIADFLSARFGKSASVAALAAAILAISSVPYVALQLKSTETSLLLLTGDQSSRVDWAVLSAVAFSAFAILFGARRADTSAGNRGLVLAIAFESILKLVAMLAVGGFAYLVWSGLPEARTAEVFAASALSSFELDVRFLVLTLLAAFAALCLPRQFHVLVVEARNPKDAEASRWAFPAYLALVAMVAPPVALAGSAIAEGLDPDALVLALPMSQGQDLLALFTFLGGFSASAGMITIAALALSTMLVDAIVAPFLLRRGFRNRPTNIAQTLLTYRRVAIVLLVLAAYIFHRSLNAQLALADIGLVSFAGAAQLAPALFFGLFWKRANRAGALAGMSAGSLVWLTCVFFPAYNGIAIPLPFGADPFAWMTLLSLAVNILAFIIAVAFAPSRLADRVQADRFAGPRLDEGRIDPDRQIRLADLRTLMEHALGMEEAAAALDELRSLDPKAFSPRRTMTADTIGWCEARLARAVGAAAARILIAQVLPGGGVSATDVVTLLDETSEKIRSSETAREESERSTQFYMDHLPALITFADTEQRVRFANQAYLDYFELDDTILGSCIADYLSANEYAVRAPYIAGALQGERQVFDIAREGADGRGQTWQVLYQPRLEDGDVVGFFGVYQDITARRVAEEALLEAYETLEDKVRDRTAELQAESEKREALVDDLEAARAQAEAATQSKTRFLAAASHDLLQPLSAARLLTSALASELEDLPAERRALLDRIDQSIENADQLLRALLDISRLDAGGVTPDISSFPLDALMQEVATTMHDKAQSRGLTLSAIPSGVWVSSDRGQMMSVLQNLVANAVRYTQSGGVLIGARRRGDHIALQVVDTGPGIPVELRREIFKEFERGPKHRESDRGLGLGLAIVDRILTRLEHTIRVRTGPKGGSIFEIDLPRTEPQTQAKPKRSRRKAAQSLAGKRIMCLDNDPAVLDAMVELLARWDCQAIGVRDESEAMAAFPDQAPDLAIIDFMLDDGARGPDVFAQLCEQWDQRPPAVLATAERGKDIERIALAHDMEILSKPVPPAALRATLSALLARARQLGS